MKQYDTHGWTQIDQPGAAQSIAFPSFFHIDGEQAMLKTDLRLTSQYANAAEIEAHEAVADRCNDRKYAMAAVRRFKELSTRKHAAWKRYFSTLTKEPAQ